MSGYVPLLELTRGGARESLHYGAVAVADRTGHTLAHVGNPHTRTFLRSTAKPFQALPFVESGGAAAIGLTPDEIALLCASHSGTDDHVAVVNCIQAKAGLSEDLLQCGTHPPFDKATAEALQRQDLAPTPNRHNCSGKHSGMLAFARLQGWPLEDYLNPTHPAQQIILETFAEMCGLSAAEVAVGVDGCSAPNFAVPLYNASLGYARLCDPQGLPAARKAACDALCAAMKENPKMVAGPGCFDTRLMEVSAGRVLSKGGADGYLGLGLPPGVLAEASPGIGITIKIADGDPSGRARAAVALDVLRQLGVLSEAELDELADFGPVRPLQNWRGIEVGMAKPVFDLVFE